MADRVLAPVLAEEAVTVMVPPSLPEVGETVNQLALSLTVQLVLDDMVKVELEPEEDPIVLLVWETVR